MTDTARLYGLVVRSEIPLHQDRPVPPGTPIDLEIILGERIARVSERPTGQVLLHLQVDRQYYTVTKVDDGYLIRFYTTCDVLIDASLSRATVHLYRDADASIAAVLAGGTVIAVVLALRGAAVLHASAVQVGDEAIAFVGASGMGKSTTATLLCADGAKLITDDLLRLDLTRTPPTCSLGATELRLRKSAGELSDRFKTAPGRRTTGDARHALAAHPSNTDDLPLKAIVVPVPDRSGRTVAAIERPDSMTAFLLLSRFPRLLGWEDEEILKRHFQQLGDIIEKVPVFVARLPWGPPFPDDVAASIRTAVGVGVG
ncbi:hypothetical protein LKO27_10065 [Tessaracoccus sp. OS52]|uniref:hypothetical protein n=1 Tax=Tessaracoccus sp. OS52 TaxID=2886691 RepID=UPI001D12E691|nr:hypothetical protein [Tessaracoccus sp. OS52]MCC2593749.1 hypothetical protein [Tessaracoccus sp. OS52]